MGVRGREGGYETDNRRTAQYKKNLTERHTVSGKQVSNYCRVFNRRTLSHFKTSAGFTFLSEGSPVFSYHVIISHYCLLSFIAINFLNRFSPI